MEIQLTQGKVALIDDEDWPLVSGFKWYARRESRQWGQGRWVAAATGKRVNGRQPKFTMHRVIMNARPGTMVDHINGDTLDNRRSNLRLCTNSQNQANSKGRGARSGFKGVHWNKRKGKWCAIFMHQRKAVFVGYFTDPEDAARAVDAKAREVRGEFARLNFPSAA